MLRWFGVILGLVLGAVTGYLLAVGEPLAALIVVVATTSVAFIINQALKKKAEESGLIISDEMDVSIAEKSSLLTLKASILAIATFLIILLWPSYFNISMIPVEVAERLYPGLFVSLGILSATYITSYVYYLKSKNVIEG